MDFKFPGIGPSSLKILERGRINAPLFAEDAYVPGSLSNDLGQASCPGGELSDRFVLSMLARFFHFYIHPDSYDRELSLSEITLVFDQFAHRRRGAESLAGEPGLRKILLKYGFALCMLADLPKTAHIFQSIAQTGLVGQGTFHGLDIGSGTGVLMLAMAVLARRSGFDRLEINGIERDEPVRERTNLVLKDLGFGRVSGGDAKKPETYSFLSGVDLDFVANETLPSMNHRLWKEDFTAINQTLFIHFNKNISRAVFFPQTLWVGEQNGPPRLRLDPENSFCPETSKPLRLMCPWGIDIQGQRIALSMVGDGFKKYIHPVWLPLLAHRW